MHSGEQLSLHLSKEKYCNNNDFTLGNGSMSLRKKMHLKLIVQDRNSFKTARVTPTELSKFRQPTAPRELSAPEVYLDLLVYFPKSFTSFTCFLHRKFYLQVDLLICGPRLSHVDLLINTGQPRRYC